jgi:hypothetical protein
MDNIIDGIDYTITVGQDLRAYDFAHERSSYIEGRVLAIEPHPMQPGLLGYRLLVTLRVQEGIVQPERKDDSDMAWTPHEEARGPLSLLRVNLTAGDQASLARVARNKAQREAAA